MAHPLGGRMTTPTGQVRTSLRQSLRQFTEAVFICGLFLGCAGGEIDQKAWGWVAFDLFFFVSSAAKSRARYLAAQKVIDSAVIR